MVPSDLETAEIGKKIKRGREGSKWSRFRASPSATPPPLGDAQRIVTAWLAVPGNRNDTTSSVQKR